MNWFTIRLDEAFAQRFTFNVGHKWIMPGVKCDVCGGVGKIFDAVYPQVMLPQGVDSHPYTTVWPISVKRIKELEAPILPLIPKGLPFGAGSEFGPLFGTCRPRRGDIIWTNYGVPLISRKGMESLSAIGISLAAVQTQVVVDSKHHISFDYLELDIEAWARIDPELLLVACPECGRQEIRKLHWSLGAPAIKRSSIPSGFDLLRVREMCRWTIASERFIDGVKRLGLTGVLFEELKFS